MEQKTDSLLENCYPSKFFTVEILKKKVKTLVTEN